MTHTAACLRWTGAMGALVSSLAVASAVGAQAQTASSVPLRPLGPVTIASTVPFGAVGNIRVLSDGRVLVNDSKSHQVVLLDAALSNPVVIIDSVSGKDNSYGKSNSALIPHLGDSTLFVDQVAKVFLVIDPGGKIARSMPTPGATDYIFLAAPSIYGNPGTSPTLGFVYRMTINTFPTPTPGVERTFLVNDTAGVLAVNLATRKLDTIAKLATGQGQPMTYLATGRIERPDASMTAILPSVLFPIHDDWALTSDGSIALLRGREYRFDWINADGTRSSSPKIPFDWEHNSDSAKVHIADSITKTLAVGYEGLLKRWLDDSAAGRGGGVAAALGVARAGGDGAPPRTPALRAKPKPFGVLAPDGVPDYWPALASSLGAVQGDADNNVWIQPRRKPGTKGGAIFDVVNRQGTRIDRVQIPESRTIAGFGANGIVYLRSLSGGKQFLERARFK